MHGKVRWLVRKPKPLGGGREYCQTKGEANSRIKEFRQSANSTTKEFAKLSSGEQAALLGLLAQFNGDVWRLKEAAESGPQLAARAVHAQDAITQFDADHKPGAVRKRNLMHILNRFALKFGTRLTAEIDTIEIERWMNGHKWGPKMWNDVRQALNQFWKYCVKRLKCATINPAADIPVKTVPRSIVPIYQPDELQEMFDGLADEAVELIPAVALSGFAGLRLSETARLTCEQVRAAIKVGHLEIKTWQAGKTLQARMVPIQPNLKAWLEKYLPKSGPVLPERWTQPTKTKENRMDELGRYIERKTGVEWRANGLRHSYGTYRFKITSDAGEVIDEMGTSLRNFERHYRKRSKIVTRETAEAYFGISP